MSEEQDVIQKLITKMDIFGFEFLAYPATFSHRKKNLVVDLSATDVNKDENIIYAIIVASENKGYINRSKEVSQVLYDLTHVVNKV